MAVRLDTLLLLVMPAMLAAWNPQPKKFQVPLANPGPHGETTQISLYPSDGPVTVLAGPEMTTMNNSKGPHAGHPVIVAMYASWCPHCWHLVPSWVQLAHAFEGQTEIEVAAVNCAFSTNRDACDAAGVSAFPDILCYGCPVSKICPRNGCVVTVGFQTGGIGVPKWMANWIFNATQISSNKPELLESAEASDGHVVVDGPPGKPGFVPEYYTPAEKRTNDALRGFLSALWSKNDMKAARVAVNFLASLFGPICCQTGGMPDALRHPAILELQSLASQLVTPGNTRQVLEQWAMQHNIFNLADQETFATYHHGVLSSGGQSSFETCTTFTCSLWTFLHMTTVSASYFAEAGSPRLSPGHVMNFTAYFVSEFMTCEACRHHFLKSFDDCEFERCSISTWKDLTLWLWRVHQGVSLRTAARDSAPVDRRWPSYEDCPGCWRPVGFDNAQDVNQFDMQEIGKYSTEIDHPFDLLNVYKFLIGAYIGWNSPVLDGDLLQKWNAEMQLRMSTSARAWLWGGLSVVAVVSAVALMSLRRQINHSQQSNVLIDLETETGE